MPEVALFVKVKAKPGKREEVKKLWEEYVKPHQESDPAILNCCYSFAIQEENTICMFELLSDAKVGESAMKSEWFSAYQESLKPLLAGPPEIVMASVVWSKNA